MSKSLRIGLVIDDTLDRPDGVQQFVLLLGSWLVGRGHKVFYIAGETSRKDIKGVYSVSRTFKVSFNGNTLQIPLPASRRNVRALLRELKLDVLHVQMPYSPFMAGRIIRNVTTERLVGTFHILPYSRIAAIGTRVLGAVQSRQLKRFSGISATSPASQAFAQSHYHVLPSVIPNAVDLKRFKPAATQLASKQFRVVFLGRLVERKGALYLLKAIASLPMSVQQHLDIVIGGDGPLRTDLEKYARQYCSHADIAFVGFIDESHKPTFLAGADLAVFPSISGESFGIVLTEAMAAGSGVVVGGANPGYRSVLGDWPQCLFDPTNTAQFADTILRFYEDKKLREHTFKLQQQAVVQYDISVVGKKFERMYQDSLLHAKHESAII